MLTYAFHPQKEKLNDKRANRKAARGGNGGVTERQREIERKTNIASEQNWMERQIQMNTFQQMTNPLTF